MTLLNTTKYSFLKEERVKRHYLTAILLLSALAMPQAVIAMDAEQEYESKEAARQEKLNDAVSVLNGLENLLRNKGWQLMENNGVRDWQRVGRVRDFNKESLQHVLNTLSGIQQTGAISGEPELRQRAGAIAQAFGFGNLAKAFSKPNDDYFDPNYMYTEMRKKIFGHAAGDGTVPRTPEQLKTLSSLSAVSIQTHEDVRNELTVEKIKANGWPEGDNLELRAQINDRVLQRLVDEKFFDNVSRIDLSNTGITGVGLASLAQLPTLLELNLSGCIGITDDGLELLAQLPYLRYLNLSGCTRITDDGLELLAQLTNLEVLNLSGCTRITDDGLELLAQLTNLEVLNLSCCTGITNEGLESLAQLTNLKFLNLSGCTGITNDAVIQFRQKLPKVKISI